jgi:thiol-disulfide isomerase/thioredoxin
MQTLNLGPLALPLAPLLLLVFVFATSWAVRRHAAAGEREAADTALWWAVAFGLLAARGAHVLSHWGSYAGSSADLLDIRDGGFMLWPGVLVGVAVLVWRVQRTVVHSRRIVGATAVAGLMLWWLSASAILWFKPAPGQHLADLAVTLLPLNGSITPGAASVAAESSPDLTPTVPPHTLQTIAQHAGGKPVVLNLWATWCGPCRAEMPLLAKAQREHPEVLFVLVNQGETEATILAYLQREGLKLDEVWRDPVSAMGPAVGSSGLPTTVFFDAQGRRQGAHVGVLSEAAIRVIVRKVAAPSGSS